jgi:hypothetical protein
MKRIHTIFIALVLGAAAAAGLFAATRTTDLGHAAAAERVSGRAVAARSAKLDRLERSLDKAFAKRPPKLPKIPKALKASTWMPAGTSGGSGRVGYVQSRQTTASPSYESDDRGSGDQGEAMEHGGGDD